MIILSSADAIAKTDIPASVEQLQILAEKGDIIAQTKLGQCFYYGKGVQKDREEAIRWYRKAAESGHYDSQNRLASHYYFIDEPNKNYEEAIKWFRKSAAQGNAFAQFHLGECYYHGRGVGKDYAAAAEWYKKAATIGWDNNSRWKLKSLERLEAFVRNHLLNSDQSIPQAIDWLQQSYDEGYADAKKPLTTAYFKQAESLYKNGSYNEALKHYRRSALLGDAKSQRKVGEILYYGEHRFRNWAEEDRIEAFKWFLMAARNDDGYSQYMAGKYFYEGKYVSADYQTAYEWYKKAADKGYYAAYKGLGDLYHLHRSDEKNAEYWYEKAAEENSGYWAYLISFSYTDESYTDYAKAIKWLELSSQKGYQEARSRWERIKGFAGQEKSSEIWDLLYEPLSHPPSAHEIICKNYSGKIWLPSYDSGIFNELREQISSGKKGDYFSMYADYVSDIYLSLKASGNIVRSYSCKSDVGLSENNYAMMIEDLFRETTKPSLTLKDKLLVECTNGTSYTIKNFFISDVDAVLISDGQRSRKISTSELEETSQQSVQRLLEDQIFRRKLDVSVEKLNGHSWRVGERSNISGSEVLFCESVPRQIVLNNKSDLPVDNLIVEYQLFFKQTIAGTHKDSNDDYRFVGHAVITNIHPREKIVIRANPPALTESKLYAHTEEHGNIEKTYFLHYPTGHHQLSSGRMRGSWVRVHKITPYGYLMREIKDGIYPKDAEWAAVEMIQNQ